MFKLRVFLFCPLSILLNRAIQGKFTGILVPKWAKFGGFLLIVHPLHMHC